MNSKIVLIPTLIFIVFCNSIFNLSAQTSTTFIEVKGNVVDATTNDALVFADISIKDSNISTVTNSDGGFLLKVPDSLVNNLLICKYLGYKKEEIIISEFKNASTIKLSPAITELHVVEIKTFKDAETLLRETLKKRNLNYNNKEAVMTAFYRETIKKKRKNASLSEAVLQIHKQPYNNLKNDAIELIKSRKSTDYTKLDTLAVKLQGGPFSNLYTDFAKYPEHIFSNDDLPLYNFSFDKSTQIDNKPVYVIKFKQKPEINIPLYSGKLYIDSETLALINAVYKLNVENKQLASRMYIRKKPRKADVYPTEALYRVNYSYKDGKWQYAYSNISIAIKVNWKGKLFNSIYTLNSELAITDWRNSNLITIANTKETMLKPTSILADETSGFKDPTFWGDYNIIEPEKSIEVAIEKIKKQLKRR